MTQSAEIEINGTRQAIAETDPSTPLLWFLRDHLAMVGTKYGCGIGQCGACTVHLEGQPVRSCLTTVGAANGKRVTTIEGLAQGEQLTPLQQAWIDFDVPQCGFCQAGQIMSATALLEQNPNPSDPDINEAMSGNYCRCGTYERIRTAIHAAAKAQKESK